MKKYTQSEIDEIKQGLESAKDLNDPELIKLFEEQLAEMEEANKRAELDEWYEKEVNRKSELLNKIRNRRQKTTQPKTIKVDVREDCTDLEIENLALKKKIEELEKTTKPSALPAILPKTKPKSNQKPQVSTKTNLPAIIAKKKEQKAKTAIKKSAIPAKEVAKISVSVRLIKRFVSLMKSKGKTTKSLENLLIAIKKAITNGELTSKSPYYDQIVVIQKLLVKALNAKGNVELIVDSVDMDNLKDIVSSETRMLSVTYLNQYFNLARSDKQDKTKMKKLAEKIGNALEKGFIKTTDPYYKEIKRAFGKLNSGRIVLTAEELAGLGCLCKDKNEQMTAGEINGLTLNGAGFFGEFLELFGDVVLPFYIVLYGIPKSGKTYLNLLFADYLQNYFGQVLYVSSEEYGSPTLAKKVQEMNLNPAIVFRADVPDDLSNYSFVFIDSATKLGFEPEDIEALRMNNPEVSFIVTLQVTKEGNFRGSQKWTHNADIIAKVSEGIAEATGRYGGGKLDIFEVVSERLKQEEYA